MRKIVLFLGLLIAPLIGAAEYTPEEVPDPKSEGQSYYVSDPDGILADSTVTWLNQCSGRLEAETGVELCIVALEGIEGESAFDFAYELFQRWGIGKKGQNTGVLILFVLASHDLQIMTGTGIEGVLTDAQCSRIMHDEMFPAFREGDYDGGLCLGAIAIYEVCTDGDAPEELRTIRSATNRGRYGKEAQSDDDWITTYGTWIGLGVALFVVFFAWLSTKRRCPKCKRWKAKVSRKETLVAASYTHTGVAEETCQCRNCGYVFTRRVTIPRLQHISGGGSDSFGGGFGGGMSGGSWGGGSTSGGGAGGKW